MNENEIAIFSMGCFWSKEHAFRQIKGVISTRVGYTGGYFPNATYRDVCSRKTGHAEAVEITFDPRIITYEQLLEVFWELHNPTTMNRQGPDVGSQYRSGIFYLNKEQKKQALRSKEKLEQSKKYRHPIVTEIVEATEFWQAEDYHQQYVEKQQGGLTTFSCNSI